MPLWGPRYLHQGSVSWDEVTPAGAPIPPHGIAPVCGPLGLTLSKFPGFVHFPFILIEKNTRASTVLSIVRDFLGVRNPGATGGTTSTGGSLGVRGSAGPRQVLLFCRQARPAASFRHTLGEGISVRLISLSFIATA